jgi:hypothetical protein
VRTHIYATDQPVQTWPESLKVLCGAVVKNPRPVMMLDADTGHMEAQSTLVFCGQCGLSMATPTGPTRRYYYGLLTAEEAHRANLRNRTED